MSCKGFRAHQKLEVAQRVHRIWFCRPDAQKGGDADHRIRACPAYVIENVRWRGEDRKRVCARHGRRK